MAYFVLLWRQETTHSLQVFSLLWLARYLQPYIYSDLHHT